MVRPSAPWLPRWLRIRFTHPPQFRRQISRAMSLQRAQEQRREEKGETWEWAAIVRGLDNLQEVEVLFQGKRIGLRS